MVDPEAFEDVLNSFTGVLQPGVAVIPSAETATVAQINDLVRKNTLALLEEPTLTEPQLKALSIFLDYINKAWE